MDVELQAICSALGYQEGSKYLKEPDCLESVKDLIRCLRRDDDTCCIRRQLGQAEIVQSDLLPLIKEYKSDRNLFETVIRLLLNLTQPARLCFGTQIPEDKVLRNYYMEVESILRNYKKAFVDDVLFAVLTEKLTDLLKLDWEHRHEEDRVLIERLLILVRNVLHVQPDANEEKRTDDDASIHDQVLWSLHVSGMEDLLLYVSNSADERQYCMHTLEIVTLMFRQQTPALLASAGVQRAISEKEKDVRELEIIREQERIAKQKRVRFLSTRHSRFGGTYVLKNVQSISDREVIFHGSLYKAGNHSFDITKKSRVTPKNRAPITKVDVVRRSTLSIRLCLKEFCVQFLENCYNPLMSAVKDNLVREVAQDHDETYYLWALRFFMEFCRLHSQQVELISETLSVSAFHYIQVNLFNYYEMITTDKKEAKVWAKRVHLALKAYQELLMTLHSMETSKNKHLVSSAKVLKGNIFYMMEFRDIFVVLLSKFDHSKYSTSYLTDLVHATHLFLKMLEISQKSNRCIVVQKKKKAPRKSKSSRNNNNNAGNSSRSQLSEEELLNLWDDVSGEVSAVLSGENEMSEGVLPFDAASEVEIDQQRADTMVRIQTCLRSKNAAEAVALLRAAREVWPDNNEFGSAEMSPEDEFLALREVFMANLSQNNENVAATVAEEFEEQEDDIVEEEMSSIVTSEEELSTRDFIAKFAKPAILQSYTTLLANFKNNSAFTNHCVIKMFHRIAVDLHQEGMFFQARLFCIFREAFALSRVKHFQEIVQFGIFIVRKFLVVAEKNKKVFMEMLFWKTAREAGELSDGYFNPKGNVKQVWTEDQEMELRRLFDEAKEDPEKDIVGHIMAHLTDETKSRGQVLRQLRISGLIESAKDLKRKQPPSTNSNRAPWTEEQETELRDVFERFRGSDDPLGNVMQNLSFTKPKNKIKDKLFGLDIVQDKKELYKKRSRRKKQGRTDGSGESGSNSDSNDDDDDGVQEGHVMATHSDSSEEENGEVEGTRDIEGQPSNSDDLPSTDIDDVLKCLVSHDYKGPISWIQRSLRRTAEDRQTPGTYVGVPVVPLTEENEEAMEDPIFLDFLLLIGLSKPITGQEAFWRITGDLDGSTLTMIADGLNLDENGQPINTAELKTWLVKSRTGQKQNKSKKEKSKTSENNGKRKKALMALQKKQTKDKKTKGKNKAKSSKNNDEDKKNSKKQQRTKKKKISENSEEENGDSDSQLNVSESNSPKFSKQRNSKENKKKKRRRIEFENSSDEDDVEGRSLSNARNGSIQIDDDDESGDEPLISQVKSKQNDDDDSDDDDSDVPLNSLPKSKKKINQDFNANCSQRKETPLAKFNSSDSDSDDGRLFIETELENFDSVGTAEKKKKKKKKRLLSDSSDEDAGNRNVSAVDLPQESDDVFLNKESKVPQLAGPSFVKKTKKRQKLIDSESSDDGHSGKTMEELDDSVAERKTVNGSKRQKIAILESSDDDDSGDEDKENHEIDSTKELNPKRDDVDLFDKAKNVQTPKYAKQNPNIINNNNTVDTFPATLLSLPNMEPETNVFDDHIPLVTAIHRKRVLSSDDEND